MDLWRVDLDGSLAENLTGDQDGNDALPHASADGFRFAYRRGGDGGGNVWTMKALGRERARLTAEDAIETMPALTSDGERVVSTSGRDGYTDEWPLTPFPQPYGDLYAVPVSGGAAVRLIHDKWEDGPCDWARARLPVE